MESKKVLVVEDESIIAFDLQQRLTGLGYDVVATESNGESAFYKAMDLRPDVILMDIHINGPLDGIQAAKKITESTGIPVVFLTAYATEDSLSRALGSHPYGYLLKPVATRELHATLLMAIDRGREVQSAARNGERLQVALDTAEMGVWEWRPDTGRFTSGGLFGSILCSSPKPIKENIDDFISRIVDGEKEYARQYFEQALQNDERVDSYFRYIKSDGSSGWLEVHACPCRSPEGMILTGVVKDVTERRRVEEELRQSAAVFETISEGLYILDKTGMVTSVNPAFESLSGYKCGEIIGKNPNDFLYEGDIRHDFSKVKNHGDKYYWQGEVLYRCKNGQCIYVWESLHAVTDSNNNVSHFVASVTDITKIRQAEEKINHLAFHDSLTGLPNRSLLDDRLNQSFKRAKRKGTYSAIMFIDLDDFKAVNDLLGHSYGDNLLKKVSKRIQDRLRNCDTLARIGGDEFVVIADDLKNPVYAQKIAKNIQEAFNKPVALNKKNISVSGSIGVSIYPDNGNSKRALLKAADTAMYKAKENGKNGICFYSQEMAATATERVSLESALRDSIKSDSFLLYYQPQYRLNDNKLIGVEALIRWMHPYKGLVSPDQFIPIANESGLIEPIGLWVVREACKQVGTWISSGGSPLRLSINVSMSQIISGDVFKQLPYILNEMGFPPDLLEIEITEDGLQKLEFSKNTFNELISLGVTAAIDDYGTGFSSLSALKSMNINRLKIDGSLISRIPDNELDVDIVEAIIAMAHRLGLKLVAEGVEHQEQLKYLKKIGCDEAQGYYLGRPMQWKEFISSHLAA